jgi:hypothetical protein
MVSSLRALVWGPGSGSPQGQLRFDPCRLPKRCFKIVWVTIKEAADKVAPLFLVEAADAEAGPRQRWTRSGDGCER